jgi:hypothetical protein
LPAATEAHRRWWFDRFSVDEIREMGAAFWPEDRVSSGHLDAPRPFTLETG